jgi:hypothetical protein
MPLMSWTKLGQIRQGEHRHRTLARYQRSSLPPHSDLPTKLLLLYDTLPHCSPGLTSHCLRHKCTILPAHQTCRSTPTLFRRSNPNRRSSQRTRGAHRAQEPIDYAPRTFSLDAFKLRQSSRFGHSSAQTYFSMFDAPRVTAHPSSPTRLRTSHLMPRLLAPRFQLRHPRSPLVPASKSTRT